MAHRRCAAGTRLRWLLPSIGALAFLIIAVAATTLAAGPASGPEDLDSSAITPRRLHEYIGAAKAELLDKRRRLVQTAEATIDQTNYDVRFYDIRLRINDTTSTVHGCVLVVADATADNVGSVQIDLSANLTIDSIAAAAGLLPHRRSGDVVEVVLDSVRRSGEPISFTVHYHGAPVENGLQGLAFDRYDSLTVISSLSEPFSARTWWPCKDRPDDKADSMWIAVTVDTGLYVASNGLLDSVVPAGRNAHTFHYTERYPIATYLFSVAISQYRIWHDVWRYDEGRIEMPLVHAVFPQRYEQSLEAYAVTPYALTVLSDAFGPYPFVAEKYGHANFQWRGAMEHQTMTSTGGFSDFGFSEPLVVHELAHQWWGDMITCASWHHIWLNEGWASYAEALYYQVKDGWPAYHTYMGYMDYEVGGSVYVEDTSDVRRIFDNALSYDKGAWVVHMLRGVLGDSLFFRGVRAWYDSEFKWGAATTENLRDVFERATDRDLDWFFQEWIYGTYRPEYHLAVFQEPTTGGMHEVYFDISQRQMSDPQVFVMPVPFALIYATGAVDTVRLWVDERREQIKHEVPGPVSEVKLDPSGWIRKSVFSADWRIRFITDNEGLLPAAQWVDYADTLQVRGGSGQFSFDLLEGTLPAGVYLDSTGVLSGVPRESGLFHPILQVQDRQRRLADTLGFLLPVAASESIAGDVDHSGGPVSIVDVVFLADYLFRVGPPPPMARLADVDASGTVDLMDLLGLVRYLFSGGPPPLMGPLP